MLDGFCCTSTVFDLVQALAHKLIAFNFREQGSFQLSEGWKAFAQCWGLGHGEQLQLSRRFVSSGCIWLDVKIVTSDPASEDAHAGLSAVLIEQQRKTANL